MKNAYRQITPHGNPQDFSSIINRMKTWATASLVNKQKYIEYSQHLKDLNSLQDISALLSGMLSLNIFPNTVIINQLIKKMNQLKQIHFALELHGIAAKREIANAITYASTITAIAKSATPDASRALRLLDEAKSLGFANAITYNSTITAIAKSATPDANRALRLFDEAKRLGLADAITYNSTITAIAKIATPDANLEEFAFLLLDEATGRFNRPDMTHGSPIDLHDLSYGEVYFGLKRRLNTEVKKINAGEINLPIIYGRGLHSYARFSASVHPLKEAVIRVMGEMSAQGVSGKENTDNPGRFDLIINPLSLQLSRLGLNSIFSGTKKTNLNPNANPFVPGKFSGNGI